MDRRFCLLMSIAYIDVHSLYLWFIDTTEGAWRPWVYPITRHRNCYPRFGSQESWGVFSTWSWTMVSQRKKKYCPFNAVTLTAPWLWSYAELALPTNICRLRMFIMANHQFGVLDGFWKAPDMMSDVADNSTQASEILNQVAPGSWLVALH